MAVRYSIVDQQRKGKAVSGTPGFIVGTELVSGALDVNGLKALIAWANSQRQ